MINLNRTLKYFCRLFDLNVNCSDTHSDEQYYVVENPVDVVRVTVHGDRTVLVEGDESDLKQLFLLWANQDHRLPKPREECGYTIFSQEWREWKEDARELVRLIDQYGIPQPDEIPDNYRFHRDRMFHDYMFRSRMLETIPLAKSIEFVKSWFDKNCFMNLPEGKFHEIYTSQIREYYAEGDSEIDLDTIATSLSYTMAILCTTKFVEREGRSSCPQTGCDNTECVFNLIDSLYPYSTAHDVVSFTRKNLKALSGRSASEIDWTSILPTTPLEQVMDQKLKDANFPMIPQYQAYDDVHRYRIDFLLDTNTIYKIGIECDGLQYHAKPAQYIADRKRDRYVQSKNIFLMRFSSVEIFNEPDACIDEIDRQLWKMKHDLFDIGRPHRLSYFGFGATQRPH